MIYVKIEPHSRARKPKPEYRQFKSWKEALIYMTGRAPAENEPSEKQWFDLRMHTVSEAEYVKHTNPNR